MNKASASVSQVGQDGPTRVFGPITTTDIVRYQGASGDFNPAHHDANFARRFGVPSTFSLGMLHAGYLATLATDWLGAELIRRFKVRFAEMVFPGDTLTCSAKVASVTETPGGKLVELDLIARNQHGNAVVVASASFHWAQENAGRPHESITG